MRRTHRLVIAGTFASIALTVLPLGSTRADESFISKPSSSGDPAEPKPGAYDRLLRELEAERQHMREVERRHEEEEAAERKRIEALEKEVSAINSANLQLQQTQTTLQTTNAQTEKQVSQIQKTVSSELGPFNFGDRINSFLGQHTFTMVGGVSAGFYYDRKAAMNRPVLDFEVNPMIGLMTGSSSTVASAPPCNLVEFPTVGPSLANLQIFPLGQEAPLELVAGLFDTPFGDWYENQSPNWVNPFITAPLLYGAEAIAPPSAMGLQARGGIQWGKIGSGR